MAIDGTDEDSLWVLPGPHPDANADGRVGASTGPGEKGTASAADQSKLSAGSGNAMRSGELFASRFKIGGSLGQGGMGTVYEASDSLRGEAVAIKVLVPGLLQDREAIRQFQSEAAIATRLSHPNIVTVYDFHAHDETHAIVMERLRGKTLRDEIHGRKDAGTTFTTAEIEGILGPVCQALEYAHAFTVHRDVKPENIWIGEDGTVKLMDFGLAMLVQRGANPLSLHTLSRLRLGSPYYMAPEQLQDARRASAAADQFAVGVIAYELLSGSLPMGLAKPLRELRPDLPYRLTDVIDRALAIAPEDRFPSVGAFWEAFQRGCRSRRSWRQQLDSRPVLRNSILAVAAVVALALLTSWAISSVENRAGRLLSQTGEASNSLQEAKRMISEIRQPIDDMLRAQIEAKVGLEAARELAAPDGRDFAAVLLREIELSRKEQKFAEADRAWRLILPRLNDARAPFALSNRLADLEGALRVHDFDGFVRARGYLEKEIEEEQEAIELIKPLAASQVAVEALKQADRVESARAQSEDGAVGLDSTAAAPLSATGMSDALQDSEETRGELAKQLKRRFDELVTSHQQALSRWQFLFPKTEPPPIEFLGHPSAKASAAHGWQKLGRYDRAFPLLTEAAAIMNGWAEEVEDMHKRCEPMWSQAKAEGRAFENPFGMRFVRIGEGVDSFYWSIWETRVMDYAWHVRLDEKEQKNEGAFWKDPGFPIGPTFPVLGVEQDGARGFAHWLGLHFPVAGSAEVYGLPTIKMYEKMLEDEPTWQASKAKRGALPFNTNLLSRHWLNYWADPETVPERHIGPVGIGEPSSQGLYNLADNTWEWASDYLATERGENSFGSDSKFYVLYGGGSFFGQIGKNGEKPPKDHIFVGRNDALGFRLIVYGPTIDERPRRDGTNAGSDE